MSTELPLFASLRGMSGTNDVLTVSALTARIRAILESDFADVGVEGEITGLARPRSGHLYFSLKDATAQIRAVVWKSGVSRIPFELADGLSVRAWGNVTLYEPRGEYQLVVQRMEPVGVGALELAFRQTVARLEAEGLFAAERKRPIPRFPKRIAVITSPTGAAVRDLIRVIGGRWPLVELVVIPSRVQGEGSAAELAKGIHSANAMRDFDFIVLTRGGGSLEDLWAFNEEVLARAIVASRLPVVAAVGHEVDVTIADLAADFRAPTPSAAGTLCTPDQAEVGHRLGVLGERLKRVLQNTTKHARAEMEVLSQRLRHAFERRLATGRKTLDLLSQRADHAVRRDLDRRARVVDSLEARVRALSPLGVLARGYSLTQNAKTGRVVRDARELATGDVVRTTLAHGVFESRVEGASDGG